MPVQNFDFSVKKEFARFSPTVERFICFVVITSVALYVLEVELAGSDNSRKGHWAWLWIERVVAGILTLEYVMRARKVGSSYLKSGAGFIDLIAVLPFWLGFFLRESSLGLVR